MRKTLITLVLSLFFVGMAGAKELGVTIATDKTSYAKEEEVKLTIKNNLDVSVKSSCELGIGLSKKTQEGKWSDIKTGCHFPDCDVDCEGTIIKAGDSLTFSWMPKSYTGSATYVPVDTGTYIISEVFVRRVEDRNTGDEFLVQSNEFNIE